MADGYSIIYSIGSYLWVYKIQIIGSAFLSLTAFEYLYRAYLLDQRQKQIHEIKKLLLGIKKHIMGLKDKSRDELEHEALELKIENLSNEMKTGLRMQVVKFDAEFEVLNLRFDNFDRAIVRIDQLEKDTEFIRSGKRWKWVVGLALIGLITTVNFEQIKTWVAKLVPW